jgi:hypothetical protein
MRDGRREEIRGLNQERAVRGATVPPAEGAYCIRCNAWRGELGSEPTPAQFVANLVEVFRDVKRVLHPSGVCVINLGLSYAGSGKGPTGHNGIGDQERRQGFVDDRARGRGITNGKAYALRDAPATPGFKPKDLILSAFFVAEALRQDGWYLRSVMPWVKRNAMPESAGDRPAATVEYLFLLSKSAIYFWDATAIRRTAMASSVSRYSYAGDDGRINRNGAYRDAAAGLGDGSMAEMARTKNPQVPTDGGRNYRNSDAFFDSWQGLLLDEAGDPLALVVNPTPNPLAHYASFSPKLVEPFVLAGTSARGVCPNPTCLVPWRRVTESKLVKSPVHGPGSVVRGRGEPTSVNGWAGEQYPRLNRSTMTIGWQPGCRHYGTPSLPEYPPEQKEPDAAYLAEVERVRAERLRLLKSWESLLTVPATVLDPFAGIGTTLRVANYHGREAVGIELNEQYSKWAEEWIASEAPLWNTVEREAPAPVPVSDQMTLDMLTNTPEEVT